MKKVPKDKESGLPSKYVAGVSTSTAKARAAHWAKTKKLDPKNPSAYTPAPGDKTAKTRESKYTKAYKAKFGEEIEMEEDFIDEEAASGLAKKAAQSGVSIGTLRKVYNRGMAAWRTGHRPGTTPQQWAMARVNSYITKGKTYHTADSDLRKEDVDECWTGYKQVGLKKKGDRMVPDCVPEAASPAQQAAIAIAMKKAGKKPKSTNESVEQIDEIVTQRRMTPAELRARAEYLRQHKKKVASYTSHTTDAEDEPKRSFKHYSRQGGDYSDKPSSMGLRHTIGAGYYKKSQMEDAEAHSTDPRKPASRFDASDELVKTYKDSTPGQSKNPSKTLSILRKVVRESLELAECNGNCTCGKQPPVTEAEYQGRQVPLNKPMKGDVKKSKVYVRNEKGNVVKVNFGDKSLSIKKNIPARKKSYCARSGGQGNLTKKTSANYWSRRAWKC